MRRDMTKRTFLAALKRRGWKLVLGCWIEGPRGSAGMIFDQDSPTRIRPNYRVSLAEAIRFHESE